MPCTGTVGREKSIRPGDSVPLLPSNEGEFTGWLNRLTHQFAHTEAELIRSLHRQKNRFFAEAAEPGNLMVATHPGIKWEEDLALISGIAVSSE